MEDEVKRKEPWADGWALWRECFKEGEDVIAVTVDDKFFWGTLRTLSEGVELTKPNAKTKCLPFDDIRFMSHDGFPVQQLMGADGSEAIVSLRAERVHEAIREALEMYVPGEPRYRRPSSYVCGHPFIVEASACRLLNPRNAGPDFYSEPNEEVLQCWSPDGAVGLLWDLDTVFHFERNGRTVAMAS